MLNIFYPQLNRMGRFYGYNFSVPNEPQLLDLEIFSRHEENIFLADYENRVCLYINGRWKNLRGVCYAINGTEEIPEIEFSSTDLEEIQAELRMEEIQREIKPFDYTLYNGEPIYKITTLKQNTEEESSAEWLELIR